MTDPTKQAVVFVVGCWAALGLFLAVRRRREPLWAWVLGATVAGAAALAQDTLVGLVPFAACVVAIVLPDGVVAGRRHRQQRVALVLATIVAVPCAIVLGASGPSLVVVVVETAVLAAIALTAYVLSCRSANALDRARLQWAGWGVVVAGAWALVTWLMHALIGWPAALGVPVVLGTAFVPLALAFASVDSLARRVDRLLVQTIEVGGLIVLVGVIYLVVVLGFGDSPNDATQRVLGLSIVAAGIAAACFVPARDRLEAFANRRVYGEQRSRDEPLQTFGARMSRAIPLDELLLQLAESLKKSMQLVLAEVWTGAAGVFERAAAVPYRDVERVKLTDDEIAVVARAHTQGNAWIQVWLPQFLDQNPGRVLRVAPLVHSGELLGLVVCGRSTDQQPFGPDDDRVLTELARQVALALHNSALDTALQASLDELRIANEELRASRARIVATGDQARRQIERNLHDGAQQHLVALAVKLGLARQLVDGDKE
ncbi:MAG TPA: GAF domain-containing protein, partial [Acidimicrobiia bacterium]|nr:GAF domain-containing protein [Acidimicrobiia bacterium]